MQDFLVTTSLGMAQALPAVGVFFLVGWAILKKLRITPGWILTAFLSAWAISGIAVPMGPPGVVSWQWTLGICLGAVAFFTFTIGLAGDRRPTESRS